MEMTNCEIVHRYTVLETPISILAELNAVSNSEIREILKAEGVDIVKKSVRPKRHVVDPKPAKPYQGENKMRKPYTHNGLYTKAAKAEKKAKREAGNVNKIKVLNQEVQKADEAKEVITKASREKAEKAIKKLAKAEKKETEKIMKEDSKKMATKKTTKAAEPEIVTESVQTASLIMNESLKALVFARLDELEVKMGYHREQITQYEREYKELCESIGIKRNIEI